MGYRSNVYIGLHKEVVIPQEMISKLGQWYDDLKVADDGTTIISIAHIKWYDSDPHISKIMEWLRSLDDNHYRFIRTGEELTDIEDHGYFGYDDAQVDMEMTVDCYVNMPDGMSHNHIDKKNIDEIKGDITDLHQSMNLPEPGLSKISRFVYLRSVYEYITNEMGDLQYDEREKLHEAFVSGDKEAIEKVEGLMKVGRNP